MDSPSVYPALVGVTLLGAGLYVDNSQLWSAGTGLMLGAIIGEWINRTRGRRRGA